MSKAFQKSAFQNDAFQWEGNTQRVTFFADAYIFDPANPTFTADAYIDVPTFHDDFDRGSLGSDYVSVTGLTIQDDVLHIPAGEWGEATLDFDGDDVPTPNWIQFDFWVPPLPYEGYHAYMVTSSYSNLYAYIDNASDVDNWALWSGSGRYNFQPVGNNWYRARFYLATESGDKIKAKVWRVGEAEPVNWQQQWPRSTTNTTRDDHYVYMDASPNGGSRVDYPQPSMMDNLIITRSGLGTITADAIIVEDAAERIGGFSADSVIVPWSLTASLDTDASPYNTLVTNTGAAQSFTGDFWQAGPGLTNKRYSLVPDPGLSGEIFAKWDFWVPNDPTLGGSFWEHRASLSIFAVDSWPWDPDNWIGADPDYSHHFEFSTRDNDELFFPVSVDTWYTIFVRFDNRVGGKLQVWVYEQGTPIPDDPTFDITITSVSQVALSSVPSINIQGYNSSPEVMRMDNSLMYAWTATPVTTFTANAVIKKTVSPTFTANAELLDPVAAVVDGDFTADSAILRTHSSYSGTLIATTGIGTQTAITGGTGLTVSFKTGDPNAPSIGFVSISLDLLGGPIPEITPSDTHWKQVASVNVDTDHALITWSKAIFDGEPHDVTMSWAGARDAAGIGWTAGPVPEVTGGETVYPEFAIYTAQDPSFSALIRDATDSFVIDPATMLPPRQWSSYAVFAGSTDTTWSITNGGAFAFLGADVDAPNASIRAARDDFNTPDQPFLMFTGDPASSQPRMSHLIVVYAPGLTFTADAYLLRVDSNTFTADGYLEPLPVHKFTANAVLLKTVSRTFTADAYITSAIEETFTADAILLTGTNAVDSQKTFSARAVLAARVMPPEGSDKPRLTKRHSMTIVKRRPLEFSAFVPPRTPDEEEEDPEPDPYCLPPCAPFGAGGGMNGWGSFKTSITKCSECDVYFRSDSEFLGQGSAGSSSAEHYEYCGSHTRDNHVTKLWVNYPSIPEGEFLLRAKLTWDINGPDQLAVRVFNASEFPDAVEDGGYGSEFDPNWTEGTMVGSFVFVNDAEIGAYVILGGEQYKYQEDPSDIVINGSTLGTNILRFELEDETTYLAAKFRASNLDWS